MRGVSSGVMVIATTPFGGRALSCFPWTIRDGGRRMFERPNIECEADGREHVDQRVEAELADLPVH
jgi:hypothetical protein